MAEDIREYWNRKVLDWERSAYEGLVSGQSLAEKFTTKFRGSLRETMNISLELLKPHIVDRTILDLGCGSGRFAFRLLQHGAGRVVGFDFSQNAVNLANEKA